MWRMVEYYDLWTRLCIRLFVLKKNIFILFYYLSICRRDCSTSSSSFIYDITSRNPYQSPSCPFEPFHTDPSLSCLFTHKSTSIDECDSFSTITCSIRGYRVASWEFSRESRCTSRESRCTSREPRTSNRCETFTGQTFTCQTNGFTTKCHPTRYTQCCISFVWML